MSQNTGIEPPRENLGPFAPHLHPQNNGYILRSDSVQFIDAIPSPDQKSTTSLSPYQMYAAVSAARTLTKKDKVKLFKSKKAEVLFAHWWGRCLSSLIDANSQQRCYGRVITELLKFSTEMNEVLKSKVDLGKAKDRMGVDLLEMIGRTKAAVEGMTGAGAIAMGADEIRNELIAVQSHYKNVYGVEIESAEFAHRGSSASVPRAGSEGAANNTSGDAAPSAMDRHAAAAKKRMERLQSKNRTAGLSSSAVSSNAGVPPPRANRDDSGWGRRDDDNHGKPPGSSTAVASANSRGEVPPPGAGHDDDSGWGRRDDNNNEKPPSSSAAVASANSRGQGGTGSFAGYDRPPSSAVSARSYADRQSAAAPATAPNKSPSEDSVTWDNEGTSEGWGRRSPPEQTPLKSENMTDIQKLAQRDRTDTRQWGIPLDGRPIAPYPTERREQLKFEPRQQDRNPQRQFNHGREDYARDSSQQSNYGRDQGSRDDGRYVSRDDNRPPSTYASMNDSRQQYEATSSKDQGRDHGSRDYRSNDCRDNRPPYESQSNRPYDSSHNDRQPYPGNRTDSSDNQPYSRGGIRNNQPVGGTGAYRDSRRDDYRDNEQPYASRVGEDSQGRRSSNDYDRRDSSSRASSFQSRSLDRPYEDRREYDGRSDDRLSSHRSDSPPRDNRGLSGPSRRYDDDRWGDSDRNDDRKRRDRDEPSRGSSGGGPASQRLCMYFFTPRGCRNGSGCRFSHEDDGERKPPADRSNRERERQFEDGGSEDGELVRPQKRFRGPNNGNIQPGANNPANAPPAAGRGRGRGAHINKPAWMTQAENGEGPAGAASLAAPAPAPVSATQPAPAMNNADLTSLLSSVNAVTNNFPPAGRGRGNVDNRPAWMTAAKNGQSGPTGATSVAAPSPAPANGMNGRFAPPPSAQLSDGPPQRAMGRGRGRGRGLDNKPAWMAQDEWDRRNA